MLLSLGRAQEESEAFTYLAGSLFLNDLGGSWCSIATQQCKSVVKECVGTSAGRMQI